jgi:hypothetical protein
MMFFGQLKASFSALVSDFFQVGADLVDGLTNGMLSKVPAVGGVAQSVGSYVVSMLRKSSGSHSPSVLTMAIGQDVMAGLELGMLGNTNGVQSAAEAGGSSAIDGARAAGVAAVAGSEVGGGGVHIRFEAGAIVVGGVDDPELEQRLVEILQRAAASAGLAA